MSESILVIGPNGAGKTRAAYNLAKLRDGEIINLDRTYLYKHFPVTTGLQDTLREQGVRRHLYEMLEPEQPSYSTSDFVKMVYNKILDIRQTGRAAIAEGASTVYLPALLRLNSKIKIFSRLIGLKFPQGYDVEGRYRRRIDEAFKNGLADELAKNISRYQNSYLIKECHFAVPTVKYVKGEISLAEAKEQILARCIAYKDQQLKLFSQYPEIQWVEV